MEKNLLIGLVLIIVITIALLFLRSLKTTKEFSVYKSRRVMTEHELVLYEKLKYVLKSTKYDVLSQVSMAAVMDVRSGLEKNHRQGARNRFDRKIIDFVIIDEKGNAKLLIELDDYSHIASRDAERDRLTGSAGLKTERLRKAHKITQNQLQEILQKYL